LNDSNPTTSCGSKSPSPPRIRKPIRLSLTPQAHPSVPERTFTWHTVSGGFWKSERSTSSCPTCKRPEDLVKDNASRISQTCTTYLLRHTWWPLFWALWLQPMFAHPCQTL